AEVVLAALNEAERLVAAVADVEGAAGRIGAAAEPEEGGGEHAHPALAGGDLATDGALPELHALVDEAQFGAQGRLGAAGVARADEILERADLCAQLGALGLVFAHDRAAHLGALAQRGAGVEFTLRDAAALLPCPAPFARRKSLVKPDAQVAALLLKDLVGQLAGERHVALQRGIELREIGF